MDNAKSEMGIQEKIDAVLWEKVVSSTVVSLVSTSSQRSGFARLDSDRIAATDSTSVRLCV
jgi:hypothetical protein